MHENQGEPWPPPAASADAHVKGSSGKWLALGHNKRTCRLVFSHYTTALERQAGKL